MEWSRTNKNRGFIASWPQFGVPAGLFLANLAVLAFSALSGDQFLEWGWRIPFLLSIVLVGIGLWVRLGILETPVFEKLVSERKVERAPIVEVIKRQPREIILSALVAHTGWHWMLERGDRLRQYRFEWPEWNAALAAGLMRWSMAVLLLGGAVWLAASMLKRRGVPKTEVAPHDGD